MKENKYDDPIFFDKYSRMPRSKEGLDAAGEWHVLRRMLPPFEGKRVLDLGCGFGWHCRYAAEQGATSVVGVDLVFPTHAGPGMDECAFQLGFPHTHGVFRLYPHR
mgnify:CR=1 FL=1